MKIADRALASRAYDETVDRLTNDGMERDAWMKGAIDFTKKSLNLTTDAPNKQVFDFSFVEKAGQEVK